MQSIVNVITSAALDVLPFSGMHRLYRLQHPAIQLEVSDYTSTANELKLIILNLILR